jgi:ATP-dependent RNA helicase SUPV3L1/SUV3
VVHWRGEAAGAIAGGEPFSPRVRLFGELGPAAARERAQRRLEAFAAGEAGRRLKPLRRLEAAVADGKLKGLARGLAYRLIETGGVLDRALVRTEARQLSHVERRALRGLGVRLGAFSLYLPALLKPDARSLAQAFAARELGDWRPGEGVTRLPQPLPSPRALAAFGQRAVRHLAVPVEQLERLDALLREGPKQGGGTVLSDQALHELGWGPDDAREVLRGLGFAPVRKPKDGEPLAWRRRAERAEPPRPAPPPHSPFAALAALQAPPAPARRRPRRRKPKAARA